MNILLTGASSFTGHWFAQELAAAGANVQCAMPRPQGSYEGLRARRVGILQSAGIHCEFNAPFGSAAFLHLVAGQPWHALCHHGACVTNYKSEDFDAAAALAQNTANLPAVLSALQSGGCNRLVLTGSVFESGEGGGRDTPAISPYGLSKSLTTAYFRYYAARAGMRLAHFVIPNPFGAFEEPRFTAYLIRTWKKGETAAVNTPDYLRDNIHATLLAKEYARIVAALPERAGFSRHRPSGYVETQGEFARRFAREMRRRLNLACDLTLAKQTDFSEPLKRVNSDKADAKALRWQEKSAWDGIADFYQSA